VDEIQPSWGAGGTMSAEQMLAIRAFNEKENQRRAEREAWQKRQEEARLRMREIQKKEQEQKQKEYRKKQIDDVAKSNIQGNPLRCRGCNNALLSVRCPNTTCNCMTGLDPVLRRVIAIIREEKQD
jgi:hypothetical protein